MRKLKRTEVEISVVAEPEEFDYLREGYDAECVKWISDQLDRGNEWAWCCVKVSCTWEGLTASTYLGACSYYSREDFTAKGGYFDDLVGECLEDLDRQVNQRVAHCKRMEQVLAERGY